MQSNKLDKLLALEEATQRRIISSPEELRSFLQFSARHYKYSFADALMLYAQRPGASAVASFRSRDEEPKETPRKPTPTACKKSPGGDAGADGCVAHQWFGEEETSLHGIIDDATGTILALHFAKNECLDAYFQAVLAMVRKYGCPRMIYADRHTIFQGITRKETTIAEDFTGAPVPKSQTEVHRQAESSVRGSGSAAPTGFSETIH